MSLLLVVAIRSYFRISQQLIAYQPSIGNPTIQAVSSSTRPTFVTLTTALSLPSRPLFLPPFLEFSPLRYYHTNRMVVFSRQRHHDAGGATAGCQQMHSSCPCTVPLLAV